MWWLMIFGIALCALGVAEYFHFRDSPWSAASAAAIILVIATVFGYAVDASGGYPIARGQHLQFAIVSVITAGVFTVFYLGGYYVGKRWPWRRKQSGEYRAHPRHQKRGTRPDG
jgi:predicted cobalt transporter CbtA